MLGKEVVVSQDRMSVTVQITENPDVFVRMKTSEVAALIGHLATLRRQMEPAVPEKFRQSLDYRGTGNPRWAVALHSADENVILHIREPGIDWLHFAFSPEYARKLGELLIASADKTEDEAHRRASAEPHQPVRH